MSAERRSVTRDDVARQAGVSTAVVSYVVPPRWWHARVTGTEDHALAEQVGPRRLVTEERGPVVLTGAALGRVGLTVPPTDPEQAAVYLVEAVR